MDGFIMDYVTLGRNVVVIVGVISFFWLTAYTVARFLREMRGARELRDTVEAQGISGLSGTCAQAHDIPAMSDAPPLSRTERHKKRTPRFYVSAEKPWWQLFLYALGAILTSRLLLFSVCYAYMAARGETGSFFESIRSQLFRWDVGQYVLIADEWYADFGNQRLALVFFPLYPGLMRLMNILTHDSFISGMVVSNLSFAGAAVMLYKIVKLDLNSESGFYGVLFALFAPMAFFFTNVFSESLFLLLTLSAVYAARKRWFFTAGLLAGLSTLCRLLGFIVALPIVLEMAGALREEYLLCKESGKRWSWSNCHIILFLAFVPLALLIYFGLNYQITGNPLEFLKIQEEHWYNTTGSIFNTMGYLFTNAVMAEPPINFDLWFTQLAALEAVFAILIVARKKLRVAELAYALVYLLFAFASDWLLSGARYLLALYAIYPAMTYVFKKRNTRIAVTAVSSMLMVFYYVLYISGRNIL